MLSTLNGVNLHVYNMSMDATFIYMLPTNTYMPRCRPFNILEWGGIFWKTFNVSHKNKLSSAFIHKKNVRWKIKCSTPSAEKDYVFWSSDRKDIISLTKMSAPPLTPSQNIKWVPRVMWMNISSTTQTPNSHGAHCGRLQIQTFL